MILYVTTFFCLIFFAITSEIKCEETKALELASYETDKINDIKGSVYANTHIQFFTRELLDEFVRINKKSKLILSRNPEQADIWITRGEWSLEERKKFIDREGFEPQPIPLCFEVCVVIVNEANTVSAIDHKQLADIYSYQPKDKLPLLWGNYGAVADMADLYVTAHRPPTATTLTGMFRSLTFGEKDYSPILVGHDGINDVVNAVKNQKGAIGFVGYGYVKDGVKVLSVSMATGGKPVKPSALSIQSGEYQFASIIQIVPRLNAQGQVVDSAREIVKFLTSSEAQKVVVKEGFMSPTSDYILGNETYRKLMQSEK